MGLKCNLIVCGPATGKTYLASYDDRFIDLDEIKAIYKYGLEDCLRYDFEAGKANRGSIINSDSFEYIIKIMKEIVSKGYIGLLSYNDKVISYILDNKIPYCLVYASLDSREDYILRMKNRGNNDLFISSMTDYDIWEKFYFENKYDDRPTYKIELKKGQYLSDIKNLFFE